MGNDTRELAKYPQFAVGGARNGVLFIGKMKQIELTKGKFAIVDDEDFEFLSQWRWKYNTKGYAVRNKRVVGNYYKTILMHREVLGNKSDKFVDHINGNPLDNRKENLRYCTQSQNCMNQGVRKTNRLGVKGVCKSKRGNGYLAQIQKFGKKIYLGYFSSVELAKNAYNEASNKYFGEFNYIK